MGGAVDNLSDNVPRHELLALSFQHSPHPQFISHADGSIVLANPAYAEFIGSPIEAVLGTGPADISHPDDLDVILDGGLRLLLGEIDRMEIEVRLRRADDEIRICAVRSVLAHDSRGNIMYVTDLEDVTPNRLAEAELSASRVQFQAMADSVPVGIQSRDQTGRLTYVNKRWSEITGVSAATAIGRRLASIIHPDDLPQVIKRSAELAEKDAAYETKYRVERPDGSMRWVTSRSLKIPEADGQPTSYVGSIDDITDLVKAQMDASRLATILETTSDLVWIIDEAWRVTWSNATARAAFGLDRLPLPISADLLYTAESLDKIDNEIRPKLLQGENWVGELAMNGADSTPLWIRQSLSPQFDPIENTNSIAALAHDASERREIGMQLTHRANHDPLTGLPNRGLLLERLASAIATRSAPDEAIAVLFLDVDNFKRVNDQFGHQVGDQFLHTVAERLSSVLRSSDLVGRFGGDEFVVVCSGLRHTAVANLTAQRLLTALSQTPISASGNLIPVTASLGVTFLAGAGESDPETLIREADKAMYRAKSLGRNRIESYDELLRSPLPSE
ncbi:MAG: diguanylate cyclase [Acidimicrobiia bacterium]|nr:diguanylate cyclase [Acidimicrobiia bacterium]